MFGIAVNKMATLSHKMIRFMIEIGILEPIVAKRQHRYCSEGKNYIVATWTLSSSTRRKKLVHLVQF